MPSSGLYAVDMPDRDKPVPARDKKDAARKAGQYNKAIVNERSKRELAHVIDWPGSPDEHARQIQNSK